MSALDKQIRNIIDLERAYRIATKLRFRKVAEESPVCFDRYIVKRGANIEGEACYLDHPFVWHYSEERSEPILPTDEFLALSALKVLDE